MKKPPPKLEAEARAFVRRYAAAYGLDPDEVWRDHHPKLLKLGVEWFLNDRKEQARLAADYQASRMPGRNSPPAIQWPSTITPPVPEPTYLSFADYLARTTHAERMVRCHAAAKKANRGRLLSSAPKHRLSGDDVWNVIEAARGRCAHCGSLAVENRPSKPNGAPAAWAQIGRRIGSLEHRHWRARGGDNDLSNLAWSCLGCNTWESERSQGATDYGGFHPPLDDPAAIEAIVRQDRCIRLKRRLERARAAEAWDHWLDAAEALIEEGEELESDDDDLRQELTNPDGPETYCIDDDWLYFGTGGRAWR
jgi:hypothetical protein